MDTCVQTAEGNWPRSTTASEFAAFLDLHVLPLLRQVHMDAPRSASFEADCVAFAAELGLDPAHSHLVQLPAWISLDNATIHAWARKLMCRPRAPDADVEAFVRERFRAQFGDFNGLDNFTLTLGPKPVQPQPPQLARAPHKRQPKRHQSHVYGARDQEAVRQAQLDLDQAEFDNRLAAWETADQAWRRIKHACDRVYTRLSEHDGQSAAGQLSWMQQTLRRLADERKDVRILLPQQFMPLAKVTPDIHSVVEHMVRTLKHAVKMQALLHLHSDVLYKARTWQQWLLEAVQDLGNGENGHNHINRSIEKQKCICQILCTPAGQLVTVQFVFRDGGANPTGKKRSAWVVPGAGGAWILDSKWT